jgi:hypothetical protein
LLSDEILRVVPTPLPLLGSKNTNLFNALFTQRRVYVPAILSIKVTELIDCQIAEYPPLKLRANLLSYPLDEESKGQLNCI